MSKSNFNFRTALNEVKETKQSQNSIKVDNFLRKVIAEINNKDTEITKEMLNEIIFLQYYYPYYSGGRLDNGETVKIYIRKLNFSNDETENNPDLDSYLFIMEYECSSVEEASIILKESQEKLKVEEFNIRPYTGKDALKNGQSFILKDILR